jgi:hypothetical protein
VPGIRVGHPEFSRWVRNEKSACRQHIRDAGSCPPWTAGQSMAASRAEGKGETIDWLLADSRREPWEGIKPNNYCAADTVQIFSTPEVAC